MRSKVGIREAKAQLSRLVREAAAGYEIIITDRGTPVAKLVPAGTGPRPLEQRLEELEKRGVIGPAGGRPLPPPLPLAGQAGRRMLDEDRGQ